MCMSTHERFPQPLIQIPLLAYVLLFVLLSHLSTRYHGLLLQVRHGFAARWPEQSAAKDPSICMGIWVASLVFTQLCCVRGNQFLTRGLQREPDHRYNMPMSLTKYLPHLRTSAADPCRTTHGIESTSERVEGTLVLQTPD